MLPQRSAVFQIDLDLVSGQRVELRRTGASFGGFDRCGRRFPADRVIALLDVLLGRAPVVIEGRHPFIGQAAIGDDEADAGEQLARMEFGLGHDPARR